MADQNEETMSNAELPLSCITSDYVYTSDESLNNEMENQSDNNTSSNHESSNSNMPSLGDEFDNASGASGEVDREYTGQFEGP